MHEVNCFPPQKPNDQKKEGMFVSLAHFRKGESPSARHVCSSSSPVFPRHARPLMTCTTPPERTKPTLSLPPHLPLFLNFTSSSYLSHGPGAASATIQLLLVSLLLLLLVLTVVVDPVVVLHLGILHYFSKKYYLFKHILVYQCGC